MIKWENSDRTNSKITNEVHDRLRKYDFSAIESEKLSERLKTSID